MRTCAATSPARSTTCVAPSDSAAGPSRAATEAAISAAPRPSQLQDELDRYCAEIGRDPASITRSIVLSLSYDQPSAARGAITEALDAGFRHIVLVLPPPYPADVARWVADELIAPSI